MKLLLIGLSASGKSTVSKLVAKDFNLQLIEADDEVEKYNGGVWPDSDEVITKVFEDTDKWVIEMDNVIYVTSWMEQDIIKNFHANGFKIIEMHADFDELVRRKKVRDNITDEKIEKFKLTYIEYFNTILNIEIKDLYEASIDTTRINTSEVYKQIREGIA